MNVIDEVDFIFFKIYSLHYWNKIVVINFTC
jgi:hypothetical protein